MMLGMMVFMPSICFARSRTADSLLINRMWDYCEISKKYLHSTEKNLYMIYHFTTNRRNALLYLVPTMYTIARGDKDYVGETYSKLKYRSLNDFDFHRQVICGTIPRHRSVMPVLFELLTPNLYGVHLFPDRILSPFHRTNRFFYKYRVSLVGGYAVIHFRPRSSNTQLIEGDVNVDLLTGRILSLVCEGEFDMIDFKINAIMDRRDPYSPLPEQSTTDTHEDLSKIVSKSRSAITNALRLLKLPAQVLLWIEEGKISGGAARALCSDKIQNAEELAKRVIDEGLNVRQIEALARGEELVKQQPVETVAEPGAEDQPEVHKPEVESKPKPELSADMKQFEMRLETFFGTKVQLNPSASSESKGTIVINYYSMDDLNRIQELMENR